ncbi:ABC transporter permease subunit [Melioribacteraceae bacterium 4301-Me]|uniref:ABC transporter permease subunit n=1 Tax=Pyranulibacter aquaticus TaxID=3163344 RepID=UPI00359A8AB2
MNTLLKIIKFQLHDILRSKWLIIYWLFFLLITYGFFALSSDFSKVLVSLINIIQIVIPLVSIVFGTIYLYSNRDYVIFMLSQPIKRSTLYFGLFLGLLIPLIGCFVFGISISIVLFVSSVGENWLSLVYLIISGVFQTIIFTGLSFLISTLNENKMLGLGLSLFIWLFFSAIYDALFLLILQFFQDYPLEKISIVITMFNPIDIARILIILHLDISALMGYTGAVFQKFFNNDLGIAVSLLLLVCWSIIPVIIGRKKFSIKDF